MSQQDEEPISPVIPEQPDLIRSMGWKTLAFYGLGSMLGAGIYGLIGTAAGQLGNAVWLAFVVAMVAALCTGLAYASIASRYPRAGGAAYVLQRAFKTPMLSYVAGLAVVASGLTSMATQSRVMATNLAHLLPWPGVPEIAIAIAFLVLMALLVYRGMQESMAFNTLATCIEAGGLIFIICVGAQYWGSTDLLETPKGEVFEAGALSLLLSGAVLTFFSFLGFEDTLNVSEEVKDPQKNMPLGILAAMGAATVIYLGVAITAVSVMPWQDLAEAKPALTAVVAKAAPWFPSAGFTLITIFAVANTALINYIMGSRLVYGMAKQGLLPAQLGAVSKARRTPHVAIALLLAIIVAIAFMGDVSQLASATVMLLLSVFILMNIAIIVLQRRPGEPKGKLEITPLIPAAGAIVCAIMLVARASEMNLAKGNVAPLIALGLIAAIVVLYFIVRPRAEALETDQ